MLRGGQKKSGSFIREKRQGCAAGRVSQAAVSDFTLISAEEVNTGITNEKV